MWATGIATDYIDLLDRIDAFLTENGSAYGLSYAGTGNGTMTGPTAGMGPMGGALSIAETWTITAIDATTFSVVGSISGAYLNATVGVPFTATKIQFTINAGSTPFVASDTFTISTAPKWTSLRRAMGCTALSTQGNAGLSASENVIDGKTTDDSSRRWQVDSPSYPQELTFTFFEAETIATYAIMPGSANLPTGWTFDYWNGSAWITLDTQSGLTSGWTAGVFRVFTVPSPVSATQYRLNFTGGSGSSLWVSAVQLRRSSGVDAAFSQLAWRAPGNDGNSEIHVGARRFRRVDIDYFDWELIAMDGWNDAASLYGQAGTQRLLYVPMWQNAIPYWFIADGRRAIVVAKVNVQYEIAYLGFFDPFFSPEQLPYPIALGGTLALGDSVPSWNDASFRWSNSTVAHVAFTHSDPASGGDPRPVGYHQMRARRLDGVWAGYEGRRNDSASGTPGSTVNFVWPTRSGLSDLDTNLDGGTTLWPVLLAQAAPNTYGRLSGISIVSGQGLSAETLLREGAIDHLVLPNINRTDRDDWFVVALD